MSEPTKALRTCSWCTKSELDGVHIVAGPQANICEDCVRLACAVLGFVIAEPTSDVDASARRDES